MENRVKDLMETWKNIQVKVDQVTMNQPMKQPLGEVQIGGRVPVSVHLETSTSEKGFRRVCYPHDENHQRPGAEFESNQIPTPVRVMIPAQNTPQNHSNWFSYLDSSVGSWTQRFGCPVPNMNFPEFCGTNPKLWQSRCETYFDFYAIPSERWVRLAIVGTLKLGCCNTSGVT